MEVILKEDIHNLGYKDDVVIVKDGYGRNYLIPQGKAVIASVSAKKMLAEELRQRAHKLAQIKAEAEELAKKLEGLDIKVVVKASNTGSIYGSVTNIQIADAIAAKGIEIDRRKIQLKQVKEIGNYVAIVRLHKEVNVDLPFAVVPEDAPEQQPKPVVDAPEQVDAPVAEKTEAESAE